MIDQVILPFDTQVTLDVAGGKGLSLTRLVRAGFPVPPGFIISATAYRTFVHNHGLVEMILDALRNIPLNDPDALQTASQSIRAWFKVSDLPSGLAGLLRQAYEDMGHLPVAVRSSATAEDLPGLSFAGQHETYLNVIGENVLQKAVMKCWSSLWTVQAIGYRLRNNIDTTTIAMAVVVQHMVPSEISGVLFTANPLTGKRTESVIDATFGLGEALVSGKVEPDHYVVNADGCILSKTLGEKAIAIQEHEGGGTVTVHKDAATQQALSDVMIVDLVQMGHCAADLFDAPQDIEWAVVKDQLYLLQSRPITTLYPLPEGIPVDELKVMFSFASVQGMLDPMTPLGCDTIRSTLIGAGKIFGYYLTMEKQSVLWEAGERLWLNITGLVRNRVGRWLIMFALPYIDPDASQILKMLIDQGRFPSPGRLRARTAMHLVRVLIPLILRALRTLLNPDAQRERLFRLLDTMLSDFEARFAQSSSLLERLLLIREMADQAFDFVIPQFVPRFAIGMGAYNLLTHLAATVPEIDVDTLVMMRGVPYNVTTEMDLCLWETAQTIRADPLSLATMQSHQVEELAEAYLHGSLPQAAQEAIGQFMVRYGMRGLAEIDLGRPRWREDPQSILQTLRSYLDIVDAYKYPDVVYESGKKTAEVEIDKLVSALQATRYGWFKTAIATRAAARMRALVGLRETPKFFVIRIFGIMRQGLLEDGAKLVRYNVLMQPDDVFYLHIRELHALAVGEKRDWVALVERRRLTYAEEQRRRRIPRLLLNDGQAFYEKIEVADSADFNGEPVSAGTVEGVVRVILDPRTVQLMPGEILVCPGTDPSWTPLFLIAGGLVMEVGGMMTHGAVVAREYGLPAVVGVRDATRRLHTGQHVRVNGSSGQVILL